jgi:hypothetical protein
MAKIIEKLKDLIIPKLAVFVPVNLKCRGLSSQCDLKTLPSLDGRP